MSPFDLVFLIGAVMVLASFFVRRASGLRRVLLWGGLVLALGVFLLGLVPALLVGGGAPAG